MVVTQSPAVRRLVPLDAGVRLEELLATTYKYRGWEDVYREKWTWDKVVSVSHLRANCDTTCSLKAYVKDGIVWREEQTATYAQTREDVPDYNPRGCAMGCIYSAAMYEPTRIKYPMKRAGERGSGKWQRLSWDQALEEIADKLLDVIEEDGHECIIYDNGTTNVDFGIGSTMEGHLFNAGLAATNIDSFAGVGDLPLGLIQSWGLVFSSGTGDNMFLADYILFWICNPSYTRLPDVHFYYEARYRGAQIVTIAPDFSPSTVHADRWLNVRYGTDAALAMGMVQVILEEGLYKPEFIKEQTDLPFLVRDDNHRFLRESDLDRAYTELSDRGGARAMVRLSRSARRNHLGDQIRKLEVPTQLIWGRNDIVTPPEAAEMFVRSIGDARIVWFDQCGHVPMIEKPGPFAQALIEFADELNARACAPSRTG